MHFYENRGAGAASSPPSEPAALELPEAAPWTGNWYHLIAAWLFGAVVLAGLVVFIMHFGAIEVFVAKLRGANPLWLAAALGCQLATYVSAAAVWFRVLQRVGSPLPIAGFIATSRPLPSTQAKRPLPSHEIRDAFAKYS
jgi:hypothetical protein